MKNSIILIFIFTLWSLNALAGTWDSSSFGNDAALDWVENELKPDGLRAVERAVSSITKATGQLEADACSVAIAACEVLAASQGRPAPDLPGDIVVAAKKLPDKQTESFRTDAIKALDKILTSSELRELWKESNNLKDWEHAVRELRSRL